MKNNKKFPVLTVVVAVIFAALAVLATVVTVSFQTESSARDQAGFSARILNDLRRIETAMLDAETGQRGFVITEDRDYLRPYTRGRQEYGAAVSDLRERLRGLETSRQQSLLNDLVATGEEKLAEMARTVALVQQGERARAVEIVQTDLGRTLMDKIRGLVSQLEGEEQTILTATLERAQRIQTITGRTLIIALILILGLLVTVLYLVRRSQKLDRTEELLTEVSYHRDRAELLAQELSHRVKNLFGIVSSIVRMTGRGETDAAVVVGKISDRIGALSRAHSLTTTGKSADHVELEDLVRAVLEPYDDDNRSYTLDGPAVVLGSNILTPLGLILHELATNAIKYGAWSAGPGGTIDISWVIENEPDKAGSHPRLNLTWSETAGTNEHNVTPVRFDQSSSGFGTKMIQMSAKQLKGTLTKTWNDGLVAELIFGLGDDSSKEGN